MSNWLFFRSALRRPLEVGAIVPSSRALARAMVELARIEEGQVVVELGAGTGAFTREVVARHPGSTIVSFEACPRLGAELARRFTSVRVVAERVERLPQLASALGIVRIDRIVSGLPWALWPEARQEAVLDVLVPFLSQKVRFVTFHYLHSRWFGKVLVTRRALEARFEKVHYGPPVWRNLPPAFVHVAEGLRTSGTAGAAARSLAP